MNLNRSDWLKLALNPNVSCKLFKQIRLNSKSKTVLAHLPTLIDFPQVSDLLEQFETDIDTNHLNYWLASDSEYPVLLNEIYAPPKILIYLGDQNILNNKMISIVGTRKMSDEGALVVQNIIAQFSNQEITTVSGLAFGIDHLVHSESCKNNIPTVAVLPTRLPRIYPTEHQYLAQEIISKGGLLLSEWSPESQLAKYCFVLRNRIIAGLSLVTIVAEAGIKSGALITAREAFRENRAVFTMINSISASGSGDFSGGDLLVESDQANVLSENLILLKRELGISEKQSFENAFSPDSFEYVIMKKIKMGYNSASKIFATLEKKGQQLQLDRFQSVLASLELKGYIRRSHFGLIELNQ